MTDDTSDPDATTPPESGAKTASEGTPVAVDITRDLQTRATWVVLLAGPIIWAVHFGVVYLVAEAGCPGTRLAIEPFLPPVPTTVTIVATVVAVAACLAAAGWAFSRLRTGTPHGEAESETSARDRHRDLGFVGMLLSLMSAMAVLFVGAPALVLPGC